MGSPSSLPREAAETLWRYGIEGRVVRVPPRDARGTGGRGREVVADLLARAETAVVEKGDASPEVVRAAWDTVRAEAGRYGVALDTMHQAMAAAARDIGRWWSAGERRRWNSLRRHSDPRGALVEYRRARRHLAEGKDAPGVALGILAMASASIAEAWWRRGPDGAVVARALVPEAIRLALLQLDRHDMDRALVVVSARHGLTTEQAELLEKDIEAGIDMARAPTTAARQKR
ncbi:MAG: hypothetical protein U0166_20980 [Acidobacteriota bacterium]